MWNVELKTNYNNADICIKQIKLGTIFEGSLSNLNIDCYLRVSGGVVNLNSYIFIPLSVNSIFFNFRELNTLNITKVNENE